jgi:hypothetical protein
MLNLEKYLLSLEYKIEILYRRTDWQPVMSAKIGDIVHLNRVSSWSLNTVIPDAMYENTNSRLLILENCIVCGRNVTDISIYKDKEEILLAPIKLKIISVELDRCVLWLKNSHKIHR